MDLTKRGWKVISRAVQDMARDVKDALIVGNIEDTILIVQLLDHNVFQVKKVGGKKGLTSIKGR